MINANKFADFMINAEERADQVNLNIIFRIYLIITKKQISNSYDWYSYSLKKYL